jgi:hypothetical protein
MSYTCQRGQGTRGRGGSTGSGVVREDTAVAWCAASEGGMGCRTRPRLAQRVSHKCQYTRMPMGVDIVFLDAHLRAMAQYTLQHRRHFGG